MNVLVQISRLPDAAQIALFCERWQISELSLFGSVLRDDFRLDSHIDVLVTFRAGQQRSLTTVEQMQTESETLFRRKVDLIPRDSLERSPNYLLRQEILSTARSIYEEK